MDHLQAGHFFGIINRRSQAFITWACQAWNLSYSEYITLMALYQNDGCSQNDLCASLQSDKAMTARNVKLLEEKGFVRREQSGADKRFKYLSLTDQALAVQGKLESILKSWTDCVSRGIDEATLAKDLSIMQLVADNAVHSDFALVWPEGREQHEK